MDLKVRERKKKTPKQQKKVAMGDKRKIDNNRPECRLVCVCSNNLYNKQTTQKKERKKLGVSSGQRKGSIALIVSIEKMGGRRRIKYRV
jgi:hypothetical protein